MEDKSASRKAKRDALTPSRCEYPGCEYVKFYQRHRIVPGRDGGKYKLGNVIGLCPNHHAEADAGLLEPEELLEIVRVRIADATEAETDHQTTLEGFDCPEVIGDCPPEESGTGDGKCSPDAGDGGPKGLSS